MADTEVKMQKAIESLKDTFNAIRTGRASASIFDKVRVDYYGQKSQLNQVSSISIPEARSIVIQPFDKSLIGEIEKAIQAADLGLNPSNDGKVVRISFPQKQTRKTTARKYAISGATATTNLKSSKRQVSLPKTALKLKQISCKNLPINTSQKYRRFMMQKKRKF